MSKERYFTVPLSILRRSDNPMETLDAALAYGIVNTGIGYQETYRGTPKFERELQASIEKARRENRPSRPDSVCPALWLAAMLGAHVHTIRGGDPGSWIESYLRLHEPDQVTFTIRSDWMWNAICQARREAGQKVEGEHKPLSWLEFRLLAALLSAKVNKYGFAFLSWESIQARACGFHTKELFKAGRDALPPHCQPISRDIIRRRLDKLEALGFFARCRYSTGKRGGFTAYSFRHPCRNDLLTQVLLWKEDRETFKNRVSLQRVSDLQAFRRQKKRHSQPPQARPSPPKPPPQTRDGNNIF